jgi:hypothetical protein
VLRIPVCVCVCVCVCACVYERTYSNLESWIYVWSYILLHQNIKILITMKLYGELMLWLITNRRISVRAEWPNGWDNRKITSKSIWMVKAKMSHFHPKWLILGFPLSHHSFNWLYKPIRWIWYKYCIHMYVKQKNETCWSYFRNVGGGRIKKWSVLEKKNLI